VSAFLSCRLICRSRSYVWHPSRSAGLLDRMAELTRLGARQVSTFVPLLWQYPDELLPNLFWAPQAYFAAHQKDIQAARCLLDTAGQDEFDRQLRLRASDLDGQQLDVNPQYFPGDLFTRFGGRRRETT